VLPEVPVLDELPESAEEEVDVPEADDPLSAEDEEVDAAGEVEAVDPRLSLR
jgi:hypothetical protein